MLSRTAPARKRVGLLHWSSRRTNHNQQQQPSTPESTTTGTTGEDTAGTPSNTPKTEKFNHSEYLKPIKQHFKTVQTNLTDQLSDLPTKLSQITGYGDIDKLKSLVTQTESDLRASRENAIQAKNQFNQAALKRAESIKEVNDLLARKASWSDLDLARFTTLVRTDHSNEQAESEAKKNLVEAEAKVDNQFTNMMQAILTRYHEEQVWSDKIRALSTTFSLSITLINVLVFLAAIVLVEPYKRLKVVSEVEERIVKRDANNADILDRALNAVVDRLSSTEKQLSEVVLSLQVAAVPSTSSSLPSPSNLENENQIPAVPVIELELDQLEEPIPIPTLSSVTDLRNDIMNSEESKKMEEESKTEKEESSTTKEAAEEEEQSTLPSSSDHHPPQPSSSWYEKLNQVKENWIDNHDYNHPDPESIKAIGIGTLVGIIILSSYHFLSK
ncbi:hypothetical protein MJO28_003542 [Puccinia striiformis f. sp. tritici]|uniref:Uncharacterized protein n=1 Tax=Puccinia striiformis f. sp. tritici TaxID=168172 RepID=A0ACC0ELH5_9BASI|nr:hypothetical protein MJO28_003542 [Puccinia striiformis f. sp. tritici]